MRTPRTNAMNELNARFSKLRHTGQLGETFHRVRQAVESLDSLHATSDPTQTREAHVAKVGRAAQQLQSKLETFRDSLGRAYSQASGRLSADAVDRLNLREGKYAEELRRTVLAMPVSERIAYVSELAKNEDAGPLLAALTAAPQILHQVPKEVLKAAEVQFISTFAPDIREAQAELDDAMDLAGAALRTAGGMAVAFQSRQELDRISKAQAEAQAAQQQMDAALA